MRNQRLDRLSDLPSVTWLSSTSAQRWVISSQPDPSLVSGMHSALCQNPRHGFHPERTPSGLPPSVAFWCMPLTHSLSNACSRCPAVGLAHSSGSQGPCPPGALRWCRVSWGECHINNLLQTRCWEPVSRRWEHRESDIPAGTGTESLTGQVTLGWFPGMSRRLRIR